MNIRGRGRRMWSSMGCNVIHPANGLGWNGLNSLDCVSDGSGLGAKNFTSVLGWIDLGLRCQWIGMVWLEFTSSKRSQPMGGANEL